jgi:hypothetical protein
MVDINIRVQWLQWLLLTLSRLPWALEWYNKLFLCLPWDLPDRQVPLEDHSISSRHNTYRTLLVKLLHQV